MTRFFIVIISLAFLFGQVARIQLGNAAVTLLDIVVAFSVIVWICSRIYSGKLSITFTRQVKFALAFLAVGLISLILFAHNLSFQQITISLLYPVRLLCYGLIFFPVSQLGVKERAFALKSITATGIGIVVLGFVQYFYYPYLRNLYYLGWDDHLYRLFSVFLDPNFASAFFVLFLLFTLDTYLHSQKPRSLFTLLPSALTVLAILLTYSRTGFIMLVIGLASYSLFFLSKRIALMAVVVSCLLFISLANTKIEGLNPFRTASSAARIESAQHALKIIERYPVLGVGFNAYRYAQVQMGFREENPLVPSHADASTDNSYLFILATTGFVGFVLFIFMLYFIIQRLNVLSDQRCYPARSLFAGFCSLLVGSLFINSLFYPMIVLWLVVVGGLIRSKKL